MKLPLLLAGLAIMLNPLARGDSPPPDWDAPGWFAVTNAVQDEIFIIPRNGPLYPRGQIVYVLNAELETLSNGSIYIKLGDDTRPSWVLAFTGNTLVSAVAGEFPKDATAFQPGKATLNARLYPVAAKNILRVETITTVNGVTQNASCQIPLSPADENGLAAMELHLSGTAMARLSFASRQQGNLFIIR